MAGGKETRPGARGRAEEVVPRRNLSAGKRPLTATLAAGTAPAAEPAGNGDAQPRRGWFLGHFMPPTGEPQGEEASARPDPAVYDHAGRLRQLADPKDPSNPNNTLEPQEMYDAWRALWTSRDDVARPRREALEEQLRSRNPAAYADNIDMFRAGRRDALGAEYQAAADEADLCAAQLSVMNEVLGWLEGRKAKRQRVTLDQVNRHALETARAKSIYVNLFMTVLLVGYPVARASPASARAPTGPTTPGAPGARSATPTEPEGLRLFHGGSAESVGSIRKGIRVDANSSHPGRQQWGRGFYLGDRSAAEAYAQQTESPTVASYRRVVLDDLGIVLDLTAGPNKARWVAYMDETVVGYTRRQLWQTNSEARGALFDEFLTREGFAPDVVVAPHPPNGQQVIIRTQAAADKLNAHLEPAGT